MHSKCVFVSGQQTLSQSMVCTARNQQLEYSYSYTPKLFFGFNSNQTYLFPNLSKGSLEEILSVMKKSYWCVISGLITKSRVCYSWGLFMVKHPYGRSVSSQTVDIKKRNKYCKISAVYDISFIVRVKLFG